jgi:biotin synthase
MEALKNLKSAGVDSYNHNIESSREFFPSICTTHTWDARFQTCQNAKSVGLMLCSGGIFGLGESNADHQSFFNSLKELSPMSIPLNFYHPNPALPLKQNSLGGADEGLEVIKRTREFFPDSLVMVAGGRESFFGSRQKEIFVAGCNSIIVGDYLTSKGQEANIDYELVKSAGFEIETECRFHV